MAGSMRLKATAPAAAVRRPARSAASAMRGFAGALVSLAALCLCAVLAVLFAATLALVTVLASVLLGLAVLAWRVRRRPLMQGAVAIARPAGHAWVAYDRVAYDWDRRRR